MWCTITNYRLQVQARTYPHHSKKLSASAGGYSGWHNDRGYCNYHGMQGKAQISQVVLCAIPLDEPFAFRRRQARVARRHDVLFP
eukprot:SAG11_NODE_1321_length_5207_cov_66.406617_3_plen_85_part_00